MNKEQPAYLDDNAEYDQHDIADTLRMLRAAARDNYAWSNQISEALICKTPFPEGASVPPYTECPFGQWFHGPEDTPVRKTQGFRTLADIHSKMHEQAAKMAVQAESPDGVAPDAFRRFAEIQRVYLEYLQQAITSLEDWQRSHDLATGLLAREAFEELLLSEFTRGSLSGFTCSVALVGIDYYDEIVREHGREVADSALRLISSHLRNNLRPYDALCRHTESEISVLLPHTDVDTGHAVIERVRARVEEAETGEGSALPLSLTISAGIAPLESPGWKQHLELVDMCLYQARNDGCNCVVAWEA